MRMQRSGFLLPALMACLLTPMLLFAGSFYLEELAREIEATATALLLGPGLLAVYLARPAEHGFATRLLGGVRFMLLLSAFCAIAAGAILIADIEAADRETWWRMVMLLSAAAALAVAIACLLPRRKADWTSRG